MRHDRSDASASGAPGDRAARLPGWLRAHFAGRGTPGGPRAAAAAVGVTLLAAGAAVVVRVAGHDAEPRPAATPPSSPIVFAEPSPPPVPSVSPSPSPTRTSQSPRPTALPPTRATSGTLTAHVFRRPGTPPLEAGVENTAVTVDVSDTARGRMSLVVDYGDGTRDTEDWAYAREPGSDCADALNFVPTWPHRYRRAGRYVVRVTVRTLPCHPAGSVAPNVVVVALPVTVVRDADTHNGPTMPEAYAQSWRADHFDAPDLDWVMYVDLNGRDDDGFVTRVTVDFGDGSPPAVFTFPLTGCVPVRDGHPSTAFDHTYRDDLSSRHEYPDAGNYTVRTTAESTDCEGDEPQRHTTTAEFSSAGRP